jgi:hypothetical protein
MPSDWYKVSGVFKIQTAALYPFAFNSVPKIASCIGIYVIE